MRTIKLLLPLCFVLLLACGTFVTPPVTLSPTPLTSTVTVSPPTPTLFPTPTPTPRPYSLTTAGIRVFPATLHTGDRASFEVRPWLPPDYVSGSAVISVTLPGGPPVVASVIHQGLDRIPRARFYWIWDTHALTGTQLLTFTLGLSSGSADVELGDYQLALPLPLLPETALPPPEPTRWTFTDTLGLRLHYLTGTAAERDIAQLRRDAEVAYANVATTLGEQVDTGVDIYLLDRVIGQGGYASSAWVAVSYTDRLYAPVGMERLLRHELTHRLDSGIGCDSAPALVREGLAVYVAGGHYWAESLPLKTATLLQTDHYIPLEVLVENFYTHQHEISYLEAGALIAYIVEEAGWAGVTRLCQGAASGGSERDRLELGVQAAVGTLDLTDFETAWLRWLGTLHPGLTDQLRLETEWYLLETMRAYQARYDAAAHFLEGILFDPSEGRRLGITADFVRRPREAQAITLELLLVQARESLEHGDLSGAQTTLRVVELALEEGFPSGGLAADVLAITEAALALGYEPTRLVHQPDLQRYLIHSVARAAWPSPAFLLAVADGAGAWQLLVSQPE